MNKLGLGLAMLLKTTAAASLAITLMFAVFSTVIYTNTSYPPYTLYLKYTRSRKRSAQRGAAIGWILIPKGMFQVPGWKVECGRYEVSCEVDGAEPAA